MAMRSRLSWGVWPQPTYGEMPSNMRIVAVGALAVLCACRQGQYAVAQDATVPVQVAIARSLPHDTANVARGVGALTVIVRNADKPEYVVQGATVVLDSARGFITKADGLGRFDSVPAGDYLLSVRRIGFAPVAASIKVTSGCEARVEVYLPVQGNCLFPCPPSSPRVVLTTCRPAA